MEGFNRTIARLKSLKIQGAENIAKESVKSLYSVLVQSNAQTASQLIRDLKQAKNKLINTRPTEPCMRNSLSLVLSEIEQDFVLMSKKLNKKIQETLDHFNDAQKQIARIGARKIRKGFVVFTHCHSTTVMGILKKARKSKKFAVHNTETRPLYQGRITASELSKANIDVHHYIDSAARLALKKADICLFGADAVQSDGTVLNKIGTELFVEIANKYEVPVYFCTDSWKFDPKSIFGVDVPVENRNRDEVWKGAPRKITIHNPAFERIEPSKINGIISELGIYRPGVFVEEVKKAYPWLV